MSSVARSASFGPGGVPRLRRLRPFFRFSAVRVLLILGACGLGLLPVRSAFANPPTPPVAAAQPETTVVHGTALIDSYAWMKDVGRSNPVVLDYVRAENAYTEAMTAHTKALQEKLYEEIKGRIKETDLEVPVRNDEYYYYSRTEEGKDYPIFCRKKGRLEAPEEITLDVNLLAEGRDFLDVGAMSYSPDHRILAYAADTTGAEKFIIYFKDLETGRLLEDLLSPARRVVWANDNKTVFYSRPIDEDIESPYQVYRHTLGRPQSDDVLLFQEDNLSCGAWVGKSRSEEWLMLGVGNSDFSEMRLLRADDPTGEFKLVAPRQDGVEYYMDHWGDSFFVMTNDGGAKNFKILQAPMAHPSKENWKEFLPHRPDVLITDFDLFRDFMAVHERQNGLMRLRVIDLKTNESHYVEFPDEAYLFWAGSNPEFDASTYRLSYTSLVTPRSVYDYQMGARKLDLLKQQEIIGGYDASLYSSERFFVTARDGAQVPVSLVYKNEHFRKDGANPLYLMAYGCYGNGSDPYFSSVRLSLLDRGFVYAIAHVRGGNELGEEWHENGKLLTKKNTYYDFIDCAEHLVGEKYTISDKLVINGGSAGGMLMAVVANWRPDLFGIVVAEVPATDALNGLMDPSLPGTEYHYFELGNPNSPEEFAYMLSWDPYYNVQEQKYPDILATAGVHDPRVGYWEPLKWVAKLRTHKKSDHILVLKTDMEGHMGPSGRYQFLREIAFQYAFLFDRLKMAP